MFDGVVFDLDGTLTVSKLDFGAMRREIGMPDGMPILEYRETVSPAQQARIDEVLDQHERLEAETAPLRDGATELLSTIADMGLKTALLTRNSRASAATVIDRHRLSFDMIVAREDAEPKPSPQPVLLIADQLGIAPERLLMVGDYKFDIFSGQAAGSRTALLLVKPMPDDVNPDYAINSLLELIPILKNGCERRNR